MQECTKQKLPARKSPYWDKINRYCHNFKGNKTKLHKNITIFVPHNLLTNKKKFLDK